VPQQSMHRLATQTKLLSYSRQIQQTVPARIAS